MRLSFVYLLPKSLTTITYAMLLLEHMITKNIHKNGVTDDALSGNRETFR